MITKTRPLETVKPQVQEERRLDWVKYGQIALQTVFTFSVLYAAHVIYLHIWRMATGH
jgi:hypothetical protein